MMSNPFDPSFAALPGIIPVFPLAGVLLLPRGKLPLNIFEPRYLAMTRDALAAPDRLIGMIQPTEQETTEADNAPALYPIGCVGRITAFEETDDNRYLISLRGLCRFRVRREIEGGRGGFRRVEADFAPYMTDLAEPREPLPDRGRLLAMLRAYFTRHNIKGDWEAINGTEDDRLVTLLAMLCPFAPQEKQALLEAPDLAARSRLMIALFELAAMDQDDEPRARH
jgi:Lon protease-like protein